MTSIMERIAEAEKQADAILDEANRTARERVTQAKNDAEEALAAADESQRKQTADALLRAREEGERIAAEVTAKPNRKRMPCMKAPCGMSAKRLHL